MIEVSIHKINDTTRYLEVSQDDISSLGIVELISNKSYINDNSVYLHFGKDSSIFLIAVYINDIAMNVNYHDYSHNECIIESYEKYNLNPYLTERIQDMYLEENRGHGNHKRDGYDMQRLVNK